MKDKIRKEIKQKRKEMTSCEVLVKSNKAQEIFLNSEIYKNSDTLMLYMPLGNETQTNEIIKKAFSDCKKVVFPVTNENSGEITPYYADETTNFKEGAFSVFEPETIKKAEQGNIDAVIVPGIAFDKKGARIGFGKGCYDKFLENLSAVKVGFCYEFQLVDEIKSDIYDIGMDYIITEKGIKKCKGM